MPAKYEIRPGAATFRPFPKTSQLLDIQGIKGKFGEGVMGGCLARGEERIEILFQGAICGPC